MALAMPGQLSSWLERIDNLELRERVLILGAGVAVVFLLMDSLFLQPTLKAQQVTEQRISGLETRLNGLRQNATLFNYRAETDPLTGLEQTRQQLQDQLDELDSRITHQLGVLTEPAQAAKVLERVLGENGGLKLTSLSASTGQLDDLEDGAQVQTSGLARYQLDLVVQGGFLDLLGYLQALEDMPWKFIWEQIDFQASEYPFAETHLRLYTLGAADA